MVQSAVLRECVVNLARVKEYIAQNVGGTLDAAGFDNWQDLMRGIQAGLLMLGKTRAVQCIERVTGHLKDVMQPGGSGLAPQALDRLADAIVSVEYYMETLQAGRSDPWYMLDNAESGAGGRRCAAAAPTVPTVSPVAEHAAHRHGGARPRSSSDRDQTAPVPAVAPVLVLAAARKPALAEAADPELIALFMEEAREEAGARSQAHLPAWDQDPAQEEALISVAARVPHAEGQRSRGRRHRTGRVRLVHREPAEPPARQDADALAARSSQALREAVAALPQLIDHLDQGVAPAADIRRAVRARACAGRRQDRSAAASADNAHRTWRRR